MTEQAGIPGRYTGSHKIEHTTKPVRVSVCTTFKGMAISETITTYFQTMQRCEQQRISVTPMEVIEKK